MATQLLSVAGWPPTIQYQPLIPNSVQNRTRIMPNLDSILRVALVSSSFTRDGAEKQFFYACRSLAESGRNVRVYGYGTDGFYSQALRAINLPVSDVYCPGRRLTMLLRLSRSLRAFRPHVVLISQFGDTLYGGIAGRLSGGLVLTGVRSNGFAEMNNHRRQGPWMLRLPHALIANSRSARKNLICLGVKPQRIQVLPNVIDLQDFDRESLQPFCLPFAPCRIVVAAIGRLYHSAKRQDRFLRSLALARRIVPALTGLIVGRDEGAKESLLRQASALGLLPDGLHLLPETDQVPALLRRVHILTLTSDYEGFPNVILEAMAARLPVVSTPAGDAGLIVQDGLTGYVVEYDDIQKIAERMIQLAQSPALRKNLGEAGRKRVEQEFNYESLANRLTAIFHNFARQYRRHSLRELLEHNVLVKKSTVLSKLQMLEQPTQPTA
jgi:L-malate glycosyltransferase